ncbi:alpha/beta fold hydrolase [Microvirga yunnanensis]|uniref:alpha/beta fold hydrolase n=1 Tax=Microvirga yunnanensis TaxID=2953740 RepID=UPI0021C96930|nr:MULTISPECIES: alpha/beta hydrolase [unclassified Microvirga]
MPILNDKDQGAGLPALVFLHYFAGSLRSWVHVAGDLSREYGCLCIDLPGFGRSPPLPAFSVDTVAQAIAQRIAGRRLGPYVLIGHSMSGKLALACAANPPPGLLGVVLVAPSPPSPEPMDEKERARLLATHGDRASAEQTLRTITRRPIPAEDAKICIADNLMTSAEAWHWWLAQGSRETITAQAERVACPVLVMGGSEDPVIAPAVITTEVMPRLANASRIEIIGAGHLLPFEAAKDVSDNIRTFVKERCYGETMGGTP